MQFTLANKPIIMVRTSSITMPSMVGIVGRAPAV